MDALVDVHRKSCSFLLIHPREVFLAWCWVIARPLSSCGIVSLSLPLGVGLAVVGWYIHPLLGRHPHIRECQLLMQWGGTSYNIGHVNACACLSLHMRGHLLWSDAQPHEACPPIYLWSSSSLERHLPWQGQDHQVSNLWHQFSGHSTTSVPKPLLWTELGPLEKQPSSGS